MGEQNAQIAKQETWDKVAEDYQLDITDGEHILADEIERILCRHGLKQGDSLIEMGCGSGHLSACMALKGYRVTLVDFSRVALDKAKRTFEHYHIEGTFIYGDLFQLPEDIGTYDFAWNSGVMEHFGDKELIALMKSISPVAGKGILYLVPNSDSISYLLMRARLIADDAWIYGEEYLRRDYAEILHRIGYTNVEKEYVSTPEIEAFQMWKAEQEKGNVSELYRKLAEEGVFPDSEGYLAAYFVQKEQMAEKVAEELEYSGHSVENTRVFDYAALKIGYAEKQEKLKCLEQRNNELLEKLDRMEKKIENIKREAEKVRGEAERIKAEKQGLDNEVFALQQQVRQNETRMFQAKNECYHYNARPICKPFKVAYRLKEQFIRGSREDRHNFWKLCKARLTGKHVVGLKNDGFNPMYNIINILDGAEKSNTSNTNADFSKNIEEVCESSLPEITKNVLMNVYEKPDIIICSVIDYDFRYQRPQHFAARFASNGHRVFYINANFKKKKSIQELKENLYIVNFQSRDVNAVYETDWSENAQWLEQNLDHMLMQYAVRDAVVVVDYPNWIHGAEYMREKYGFSIVTDYMDDFTGFLGTTSDMLKQNCIRLLEKSDLVVASSQFLYDIAVQYAKQTVIVRNGTETEHFHKAVGLQKQKDKKVIGYYGAVAHWFAWEKVCYLAEHLPECDIVIIGDVTEHGDKLGKYANIHLLGEKPYTDLPEHLAYFDVCLIPFDTSTDLIKATNPVKFYEYLSAGKKIVATEIPELMPYKDKFVYMSNDDAQFLEYMNLCLEGKDCLESTESCIAFARENDWQRRYEAFSSACISAVPKVSVIVLTYNNLELNKKCVDSILHNTAYPNYELILVDNHSTDGTVEYLQELEQRQIPQVKVILNSENLGFAGGNNVGIKVAEGEYVLLLNNDTVVSRGWITGLVKHTRNTPDLGMCGSVTNSIGNEAQIMVNYQDYKGMLEFAYRYTQKHMDELYKDVDRLAMFCILIRRDVMETCGLLDERYQVGMFEDDDYTQAVLRAGYQIAVAEDSFVHHVNNASFKKLEDERYTEIFEKNKKLYEEKWETKWKYPKYREGVHENPYIKM